MDVLIQGAKAGQKQPKRPSIADDTIASISRLKALYLLSEGEIKGLANGAASIELEGTPLVDDSGNPNFEGVEWEIRTGTVDQEHIAGMPSASNEVGINTTLSSDTPYIRKISNTQLSSVNVNVSFPLLKQVEDDGDVVGVTVAYAIDVQTDGMGYVTMLNTSLKAKTSGRYQKTHNIKLPEAQTSWQIRVRKITADGNNETLFNAMQIDSMGEIIDIKLTYPCSALLYLSFDAKTFNNIPKIAVDTMGAYVQVPTNYDPVTRTRTGIWDGTFKLGYTTNPVWHYYNLVTNDRYGLGDKLQPFMIDKWSLEHIARICDEPVDDGNGGTEPRFTCNLYLQSAEDAYQVLQHIAGIFRGMSFWNGSKIFVDADTARDCEYVITRANVVGGAFVKTGSAASDRHTIAKVAYSNPANNYETDYAMVRNEQAIAQYGINVLDLSAVGCTSEGQAYRMGLAALLAETNRTQTVSFAMGLDGSLPSVASRIDIADMMFTGANTGGRISAVSTNRKTITVDRDNVPVTVGDKLIVNLESGKAQERVITAINGRAITVALAFDAVAAQNVWAINSDTTPTMPFIVMSVVQNEDGTQYNYTAMQYDPTMYSQIDNGTIIEQRPTLPSSNPYTITAPEAITVTSRHRVTQGQTIATLVITWAQVKDAVAYDVEWRKDDGDWIKLPRTGNISAEVDGVYSGNYLARVRAVSAFDAVSKPVTSTLTVIQGKVGKPPTLLSINATGLLFGMRIDWVFAPGSGDTAYTEIQVASAPDVNVATLGQFAYNTDTHTINGLQGGLTQHYRGRIVDKLGNTSDWTPWISGTTDMSAAPIMDMIQGQIDESALDQALRSEIGKIGSNKVILDSVAIDVSKAKADIVSAINKADAAKADAAANKIDLIKVNEAVADNKTAVDASITTLTNKDISLTNLYTALQSEYATNKAKVVQDIKTLSDKDIALTDITTELTTKTENALARIANSETAISDNRQALAQSKTEITAAYKQAIDDIEVGDRNLLPTYHDLYEYGVYASFRLPDAPTGYTLTFRDKKPTTPLHPDTTVLLSNAANPNDSLLGYSTLFRGGAPVAGSKLKIPKEHHYFSIYPALAYAVVGFFERFEVMVVKGDKAVEWSPAPEDIDASINSNKAAITSANLAIANANQSIASSASTLRAELNTAMNSFDKVGENILPTNPELYVDTGYLSYKFTNGDTNYRLRLSDNDVSINVDGIFVSVGATGNPNTGSFYWLLADGILQRYAVDGFEYNHLAVYPPTKENIARFFRRYKVKVELGTVATEYRPPSNVYAALQEEKIARADAVKGLYAQYTVKLDVGGRVSGFGLASSASQSDFAVNADKFYIAPPTGSSKGVSPFMALTTPQTINGVVVPAGTYIQSAFIHKAAIDTLQVKDGAIKSAQIDDLAVTTAKIDNLSVTGAKIKDLAVDTLQIAGNAITVSGIFYAEQRTEFNIAKTDLEIAALNVDSSGGSVSVDFGYESMAFFRYGSYPTLVLKIMRNSEVLREYRYAATTTNQTILPPKIYLPFIDRPPQGNNRYSVVASITDTGESEIKLALTARSLVIRGAKDDRN